jgi:hypothetical protein
MVSKIQIVSQFSELLDAGVRAHVDSRVAEDLGPKDRNRDETRIAFRAQDCIGRERHFRRVEFAVFHHAPESLARPQKEVVD